jgi:quercetin dioxygenase-like cupin family protein
MMNSSDTMDQAGKSLRRKVMNFKSADYGTYRLQGEPQRDLTWCNISYDEDKGEGFFLVRFAPGGQSIPHEHLAYEEFVVLEGELHDHDGTVYRTGDCVSLAPGTRHFSISPTGCTVAVFVRGGFRTLDAEERGELGDAVRVG